MTTQRPSKRAVMKALRLFYGNSNWTYHEIGPDRLGWHHAFVEISLSGGNKVRGFSADGNVSVYTLRRRLIEACDSFHGGRA